MDREPEERLYPPNWPSLFWISVLLLTWLAFETKLF